MMPEDSMPLLLGNASKLLKHNHAPFLFSRWGFIFADFLTLWEMTNHMVLHVYPKIKQKEANAQVEINTIYIKF